MQSLDVTSRAYEPAVLSRFSLEVSKALTVVGDGQLLILLPGMAAVTAARALIDNEAVWPEAARERVRVSSVATQGAPKDGEEPPAAVVLVGLNTPASSDDMTLQDARAWMRCSEVAVCINPQLSRWPVEMASFEPAYCLITYTVARTDTTRADADLYQTDAGTAALLRRFPADWRVLLDISNTKEWVEVAEMPRRPPLDEVQRLILPRVERHQATLDALQGSLSGSTSRSTSGIASGALVGGDGSGGGGAGLSTDALAPAVQDANGVVSLTWETIQAAGAFGPMALYSALALLRMRVLGGGASLDRERDARGIHLLLPEVSADGAAATDFRFGKLKAGLIGACQLCTDADSGGIASIEQFALRADVSEAQVAALLSRAVEEARAAGQASVLALVAGGAEAPCAALEASLRALGFAQASENVALAAALEAAPEAWGFSLVSGAGSDAADGDETAEAEGGAFEDVLVVEDALEAQAGPVEEEEDEDDESSPLGAPADEAPDGEAPQAVPSEGVVGEGVGDDADSAPGATEDDIARLKRMFGSSE